jgi:hypothetical protein
VKTDAVSGCIETAASCCLSFIAGEKVVGRGTGDLQFGLLTWPDLPLQPPFQSTIAISAGIDVVLAPFL